MSHWSIAALVVPLAIIIASGLFGLFVQKAVLGRLRRVAQRTSAAWDDILIASLRGVIMAWAVLAGAEAALKYLRLRPALDRALTQAITILVILSVTYFVARLVGALVSESLRKSPGLPVSFLRNLTWMGVGSLGLLTALDVLNVRLTPLLTALGVGGLAVSLALQDTLTNLFAGLHLLATRKIRPGDYIKLQSGEEGNVRDITWRNTTVEALAGNLIIIPNGKLAAGILTNYDLPRTDSAVLVEFGVSYKTDLRRCEGITVEVARGVMARVPGGVPDFTPFVRFHAFGDFAVQGTVILRGSRFVDGYLIKHEFVKDLHERFAREGIEIPFPIRTVRLERAEG